MHIQNSDTASHGVLMLTRIHLKDKHMKKKCNSSSYYTEESKAKFCYTKSLSAVYNYHRSETE